MSSSDVSLVKALFKNMRLTLFISDLKNKNKKKKKKKKSIPKTNKILVGGDILWFVREISEFSVFFTQECGVLRLTASMDQNYQLHVRLTCVCLLPDVLW